MAAHVTRIKGFADMFPPDSDAFLFLEETARRIFSRCGFVELRTPVLEYTDLFRRSIGEETDVVQKEMFTFPDRNDRLMTMRPEATAGVMRAYIEDARHTRESVSRLFTTGPMFRYERPQKGRMRQFHQLNCECLGSHSPYADADMIIMLMRFLREAGLTELSLKLNSLGCATCRPRFKEALVDYLKSLAGEGGLCEDCTRRMQTNPLRVLDCKQEGCRRLTDAAPRLLDYNCPDCRAHFDTVVRLLEAEHIPYELDHRLVRGLDYYCRTTFEVVSGNIGSQSAVAGGGRYDGLVKSLGGPDVPGVGFACGMERLALLLPERPAPRLDFYAVGMNEAGRDVCFSLAQRLREAGLTGEVHTGDGGFKSSMRQAGKSGARYCLIVGEDEAASGKVMVKNMDSGEQQAVPQSGVVEYLASTPGGIEHE